jgi:WD40 repeat protein
MRSRKKKKFLLIFFQLDARFKEFRLLSILSEHKKTITSISWHPNDPDLLASSGADLTIYVWKISQQRSIAFLHNGRIPLQYSGSLK